MKSELCEICNTRFDDGSCHCSHAMDAHFEKLDKQRKKDVKVLKKIKCMVSNRIWGFIMCDFSEMDNVYDFQIVDSPMGDAYEENEVKYFVDQYVDGGYSGDTFEGYVYVDIGNGQYFRWTYEC